MPTNTKYQRTINSMIVASLHLQYLFAGRGGHFGSFAVSDPHPHIHPPSSWSLMAPSIHPSLYLPAILSSIHPSFPHDLSSASSSFMLLLISMTKKFEKLSSLSVHLQPENDSNPTVCGFHVIDGRQTLKQTHCFDGLLSIRHKYRL